MRGSIPRPGTFQSTLSMRRATSATYDFLSLTKFQSTLSMRRATDPLQQLEAMVTISIHALHEESDSIPGRQRPAPGISIHALHEESDRLPIPIHRHPRNFNPRSP